MSLLILADYLKAALLSHREHLMIGRRDVATIYAEQEVARRDAGNAGGSAGMDILKDPTLAVGCVIGEISCTERGTAGRSAGATVKGTQV